MLKELLIVNFAIIQNLELQLNPGLSIFTGETGAGKSIILDAIVAILGGRVDSTLIRSGSERASVEGIFSLPEISKEPIREILSREDLLDDPDQVILSRELRREGRNIARINGRSVNVALMKDIGSYLIDIHGQSEHLSLLNVRQHINLLDRYAASEELLSDYRDTYKALRRVQKELLHLHQSEQDAARKTDMLIYQINEIENGHLIPGEDDDLQVERDRLANAENLATLSQGSLLLLDEGNPEIPSISDLLGQAIESITALSRIDNSQNRLVEQAENAAAMLEDIGHELRSYQESLEYNPARLEQVENRIDLIHNLIKKYGSSINEIQNYQKSAQDELDSITHAGEKIENLESEERALIASLIEKGLRLSEHRKNAATQLGGAIEKELSDLSMSGAKFIVQIDHIPNPKGLSFNSSEPISYDDSGFDHVEFLIAPNPGEGFQPLVKIASGGETSRLMLALKNVLTEADHIPTLIFDEIDQGIGGRVGMVVGEKLWKLSAQHQVMCVTHLPQLAVFGDQHFRVQKHLLDGRTVTEVDLLRDTTRTNELAQMMGGISEANLNAAIETLTIASQKKSSQTTP